MRRRGGPEKARSKGKRLVASLIRANKSRVDADSTPQVPVRARRVHVPQARAGSKDPDNSAPEVDLDNIWGTLDSIKCGKEVASEDKIRCCDCDPEDVQDTVSGDIICYHCGIIKAERVLTAQDQFDSNDNRVLQESSKDEFFENKQVSTRIGSHWRCKKFRPSALLQKLQLHTSINQQQMYRNREFQEIERMCESIQTSLNVANSAKHYFNDLCKVKTFRGVNRTAMKACAIMRSLKDNKVSRDVSEMVSGCGVDKKILTRNIKIYEKLAKTKLLQENKSQEIYRYLQRLGVDNGEIFPLSNKIVMQRDELVKEKGFQGKSPRVIYAYILKGMGFEKKNICQALHISMTAF